MGSLLEKLGLKRLDSESDPRASELTAVDPSQLCPALTPGQQSADREALARRAKALTETTSSGFVDTRTSPSTPTLDSAPGKDPANRAPAVPAAVTRPANSGQ
jgi:hypothetical protein